MAIRLIQISAWNDSGGGFLHRLFDGHPQLNVWPFELLLGNDAAPLDRLTPDWFHGRFRWPRLHALLSAGEGEAAFDAISDLELKSVLRDARSAKHRDFEVMVALDDWRRATVAAWTKAGDRSQAGFLQAYLASFLTLRGQDPDARPLLGHCPVAILDSDELFADFPDARMIHVVRDPLAGFRDMRARHPALDPARYAEKWALTNTAAVLAAAKHPERVRIVRLRQLLEHRAATMQDLAAFLGLAFHPALLTPSWEGRALHEDKMGPFGGVPSVSLQREDDRKEGLDRGDIVPIESSSLSVSQLLSRLFPK